MGSYNNMVITTVGQAILTSVLGTQGTLTFSKFQISSYQYSSGTDLSALTSLNNVEQTVAPSSAGVIDANNLYVSSSVDNDGLAAEYTAYTLGIFASDGNSEVLFGVSTAVTPDVIPADTGGTPSTYTYRMQLAVSSADNITIDIDTGAYALASDLQAHKALTPESTGGAHGIAYVDEVLYINGTEVKTGSGGSTVVVTTEEPTLVGKTVTLTISGETYTGEFDNTGECIFEGITETGTATITASDGNETTTESLTIAYYSKYAVELWLGTVYTINISTTEATLYGKQITLTNGTDTATTTFSGSGTAVKKIKFTGNVTISSTDGNKTATKVITVASGTSEYSVALTFVQVYGASWDGTSTTSWTRTDAAANFTDPVPYVAGASSYGSPFDDLQPWAGMVKSTRDNNVVVAIPKFWYKITQNGAGMKVQIADGEQDGFSVAPAHIDRGDGNGERDVVYVGRYHCDSSYKSKSGVKPVANITRSTARTSIHNTGSNLRLMDFATRFTLWLLYIVEFADWNSQAKIGYGCGNNSATENMGYTDSMPYHTGTMLSSRTTYGVGTQYRNIEGLWDNVLDWIDGCYYNSSGLNIIMNPNDFSDSSGGTAVGVPSNGYPSAFSVKDVSGTFQMFIPTAASGSESTYSCDCWYFGASSPCLCVGGYYSQNGGLGMFYVTCYTASSTYAHIGCRLLELP